MTIDDCIDWLCRLRTNVLIFMPYVWHKQMTDTLTMAIVTVRKYQKITEIVKAWNDMNSFDSMVQISEVLEDGY